MLDRQQVNRITIASPCTASWERMKGDDQVRHCGECNLNVYNISEMSLEEISALLARKEGRTCVRFYRRADGTILTDDCPVGLRRVRRKLAMVSATAAALLTTAIGGFVFARAAMGRTLGSTRLARIPIVRSLADWMAARPQPPDRGQWVAGGLGAARPRPIMGKVMAPRCDPPAPRATMGEPVMEMGDVAVPAGKEPVVR